MSLSVWKKAKAISYKCVGKALHDHQNHPTIVEMQGANHCYFWGIGYLLTGFQDQDFAFRQSLIWPCCIWEWSDVSMIPTSHLSTRMGVSTLTK